MFHFPRGFRFSFVLIHGALHCGTNYVKMCSRDFCRRMPPAPVLFVAFVLCATLVDHTFSANTVVIRPSNLGVTSVPARRVSVCAICGRHYGNRQALAHHMKMHQGLTTCPDLRQGALYRGAPAAPPGAGAQSRSRAGAPTGADDRQDPAPDHGVEAADGRAGVDAAVWTGRGTAPRLEGGDGADRPAAATAAAGTAGAATAAKVRGDRVTGAAAGTSSRERASDRRIARQNRSSGGSLMRCIRWSDDHVCQERQPSGERTQHESPAMPGR